MNKEQYKENLDKIWEQIQDGFEDGVTSITFEGEVIVDNIKYKNVTYYPSYVVPSEVIFN